VYLAFIVFKSMLTATMIRVDWWSGRVESFLQLAALMMVMWKAASGDLWTTREKILAAFLSGSLLLSWHSHSYAFIYELAVLIFLAHGMEFRKILTVHLAVSVTVTLVAVILALSGRIENLTYYQEAHHYRAGWPSALSIRRISARTCSSWL
jgi:asparagine N-glycosylation enzyme membrane subunit Stt3